MEIETLKEIFGKYKKEEIFFTKHAELQAWIRGVDLEEVKKNIINPDKLVYAEEQESLKMGEKKYNCYFSYSKHLCHRYILTLNRNILIVTIIKINRDWQKAIG
jgi:hypothetical protein